MTIEPITLDQLTRLALDESGRLYWDGQQVVTTLSLPWFVNVAIIATALAAAVGAIWPIVRFFRYGS